MYVHDFMRLTPFDLFYKCNIMLLLRYLIETRISCFNHRMMACVLPLFLMQSSERFVMCNRERCFEFTPFDYIGLLPNSDQYRHLALIASLWWVMAGGRHEEILSPGGGGVLGTVCFQPEIRRVTSLFVHRRFSEYQFIQHMFLMLF